MKKLVTTIATVLSDLKEIDPDAQRIDLKMSDNSRFVISTRHPKFDLFVKVVRRQLDRRPLFVAADAETLEVENLLMPVSRALLEFRETSSRQMACVNFIASPSTFTLSFNHARYSDIKNALQRARASSKELWVAANPFSLEILHVQDAAVHETRGRGIFANTSSEQIISFADAESEFQRIKQSSGIPFKYLPDCCNARAHEMCRIMVFNGFMPSKAWNYSAGFEQVLPTLQVQKPSVPPGFFKWSYHVAPVVRCRHFGNDIIHVVIDPTIFDRPVSLDQWAEAQQDPHSTVEISGPKPFHRTMRGRKVFFDPLFEKTEMALAAHRYHLELAALV